MYFISPSLYHFDFMMSADTRRASSQALVLTASPAARLDSVEIVAAQRWRLAVVQAVEGRQFVFLRLLLRRAKVLEDLVLESLCCERFHARRLAQIGLMKGFTCLEHLDGLEAKDVHDWAFDITSRVLLGQLVGPSAACPGGVFKSSKLSAQDRWKKRPAAPFLPPAFRGVASTGRGGRATSTWSPRGS